MGGAGAGFGFGEALLFWIHGRGCKVFSTFSQLFMIYLVILFVVLNGDYIARFIKYIFTYFY